MAALLALMGTARLLFLRPFLQLRDELVRTRPVVSKMTESFVGNLAAIDTLKGIALEFQPDHETTLKDQMNRVEKQLVESMTAIQEALTMARQAQVDIAADRRVDHIQRNEAQKQMLLLDRLAVRFETGMEILIGLRSGASDVATNLVSAQSAVDGVARDLAESHAAASSVNDPTPGMAADAAARTPPPPE